MRFAYLDESGIGDPTKEPYVVVAGVVVNADRQLKPIETYLLDMVNDFIRPADRDNFVFHAKHLFNGGGVLRRETYPKDLRARILLELCSIPKKFDLPIVMGWDEKSRLSEKFPSASTKEVAIAAQAIASTTCLICVERYMREIQEKHGEHESEVATLIYENNDQARFWIRDTHNFLRKLNSENEVREQFPAFAQYIPLQKVAETAFFAEKNESSVLQVADAIAYVLNKKMRGDKRSDIFFPPIDGQLIVQPKSFLPLPSSF